MNTIFALCENRHKELEGIPALFPRGFFKTDSQMFDYERMQVQLHFVLNELLENRMTELPHLFVYVTGYTPAILELSKFCRLYGVPLVALHWDKSHRQYVPQNCDVIDDRDGYDRWELYRDGNIDGLLAYISGNTNGDIYELKEAGMCSS